MDEKPKRGMNEKAAEALRLYRENKEEVEPFKVEIDENTIITADRHQYILHQGKHKSYFVDLANLLKHLLASGVRQSSVNSIQAVVDKLNELNAKIESAFKAYDPAFILTDAQ